MKKRTLQISVALLAAVGIFLLGHPAAAAGEWAATVVIWLSQAALWALNMILILVIQALLFVASIQEFTDSQAVILGWVIVRDICNMFFVVVLMVIAFGTILNIPDYSYKKWLPKLVLFAVLINFSKTICGLLIDISQVVMLTFVNAFKDIGGANLVNMLGISDIVTLNTSTGGSDTDWAIAGAYVLGVIYLLIALVVIATMVMILVMRLIMIWIYIVLSPAAYLLAAVPGGQKYSSQWWDEFIKNLIVGPVLAFFIWLSLAALGTSSVKSLTDTTGNAQSRQEIAATTGKDISTIGGSVTKGATASALIKFVIAIGMLVGGLMVSQQIGGAAGSLAGKGMSKIQKGAAFAGGLATGAGKGVLKWTGRRAADARDVASDKLGVDLNLKEVWKRRNEQAEGNRQLRLQHIRKKTLETAEGAERADGTRPGWLHRKMALASTGDVAWQNIVDKRFGVLSAGSPTRTKKAIEGMDAAQKEKNKVQENIDNIQGENARTITVGERRDNMKKAASLRAANEQLKQQKSDIVEADEYKELVKKEENRTITSSEKDQLEKRRKEVDRLDENINDNDEEIKNLDRRAITVDMVDDTRKRIADIKKENEDLHAGREAYASQPDYLALEQLDNDGTITPAKKAELETKRKQIKDIDDAIDKNNEEISALSGANIVVKDDEARKQAAAGRRVEIAAEDGKLNALDEQIKKFTEALEKNKLSEIDTARANIDAKMEGEASKKIGSFANPDQLIGVFKEALASNDLGLIAATYKKLAKTGNYNSLHSELGIGTGYEGMVEMAKILQKDGGMSQQDARALIAEVGEIAKGIGHMEAFGAMSMNKAGQWEETGRDQQEAIILSEKSKMQVQKFARDINRLGAGSYVTGKPHNAQNWKLSNSTIALFASKDEKYANEMRGTGNINMIQFIGANPENIRLLKENGAKEVAKLVEETMKKMKNINVTNPLATIRSIKRP